MSLPVVIDREDNAERVVDIYSRLMQDRRYIYLSEQVNEATSNRIVGQLLYLSSENPEKDITFFINSPGGSVTAGLAIYDLMQTLPNDVRTVCLGQAASMGALLLTAGAAGKRFAFPNARIMIHQPLAGLEGTAVDIDIHARELLKVKRRMNEILLKHTGQPLEKIEQDTDRDRFMSPGESKEYGLIDHVAEDFAAIAG